MERGRSARLSALITRLTCIVLAARIGSDELLLVGAMIVFGLAIATVPAFISYRRPVIQSPTSP
jgi:putative ABC transport system permease protein